MNLPAFGGGGWHRAGIVYALADNSMNMPAFGAGRRHRAGIVYTPADNSMNMPAVGAGKSHPREMPPRARHENRHPA